MYHQHSDIDVREYSLTHTLLENIDNMLYTLWCYADANYHC